MPRVTHTAMEPGPRAAVRGRSGGLLCQRRNRSLWRRRLGGKGERGKR